jgi:periplasmic divalent cation tolerance protein
MVLTSARGATPAKIIEALLSKQLAACIQSMPVRSHYVWQGVLRDEAEELLIIKAKLADWLDVEQAIRAVHDYDTPEILRFDIDAGSESYLEWMTKVTR